MLTIRPYQRDANYQLHTLINAGRHPILANPTGTGKTKTAIALIGERIAMGKRIWVLTPQTEIFAQWLIDAHQEGLNPGTINDKGIQGRDRRLYIVMPLSAVNLLHQIPERLWPDEIITDECVSGDTIIETDKGKIKISEITGQGATYALYYDGVHNRYGKILRVIDSGVKDAIEITLESGKTIKCTENHLLYTGKSWKQAGTLKIGNKLFVNVDAEISRSPIQGGGQPSGYQDIENIKEKQLNNGPMNIKVLLKMPRYARAGVGRKQGQCAGRLSNISKLGTIKDIINIVFLTIKDRLDGISKYQKARRPKLSERYLEMDAFSSPQKEVKAREYAGLTDCAKKIGWNTKPKTCQLSELKHRLRKTMDTENGLYEEDQKASNHLIRYIYYLLKMAKNKLQAILCLCLRRNQLHGGSAMTGQVQSRGYFSILKGIQKKKTKLSRTIFRINTELAILERTAGKTCILYRLALMLPGFYSMILKTIYPNVCNTRCETITSIKKTGQTNVYDLEIESGHCYFSNGVLSHNCHHSAATTWQSIYDFFPNAVRIGLTATPRRTDRRPLSPIYTDIIQTITQREAIDQGYLANPLCIVPKDYHARLEVPGVDIDTPEGLSRQAAALGETQIIGDVLGSYAYVFAGLPVLVACSTYPHAEQMTSAFNQAGWKWAHIHSNLPDRERARLLRDIRTGKLNGLCTVGIGIEGMDVPGLYGLIWLRRTMSLTIYLQFIGRILRTLPGKKYGVILDPVGNLFIHGFPDMPHEWSLGGVDPIAPNPDIPTMISCPWCGTYNATSNLVCHFCNRPLVGEEADGARKDNARHLPAMVDGELIAVTSDGQARDINKRADEAMEESREEKGKEADKVIPVLTRAERSGILRGELFARNRPNFEEAIRGLK